MRERWSVALLVLVGGCTASNGAETASTGVETSEASGDPGSDAESSSGTPGSSSDGGNFYHPPGFLAPEVHGHALKFHDEDCRDCHGADLSGGTSGIGCDTCHQADWRTDCTYCHGGTRDETGAPPRDLDGETKRALQSFIAHDLHVKEYEHAAYDCTQCHVKPTDVLSDGHIFDVTDGKAEVDFAAGLSAGGNYDGAGGCDSLYCHGDGRQANGVAKHDMPSPDCGGCHAMTGTSNENFTAMSGRHAFHVGRNLACQECHDPTAVTTHVDGKPDVLFESEEFSYEPTTHTCQGACHGESHLGEVW